jgi:hypothetical protein
MRFVTRHLGGVWNVAVARLVDHEDERHGDPAGNPEHDPNRDANRHPDEVRDRHRDAPNRHGDDHEPRRAREWWRAA